MVKISVGTAVAALASDTARSLVRFPLWWYTDGALKAAEAGRSSLHAYSDLTGFRAWRGNLFAPMYGDTSFAGRVISFCLRLVITACLALGAALWLCVLVAAGLAYLALPLAAVMAAIYHGFGLLA